MEIPEKAPLQSLSIGDQKVESLPQTPLEVSGDQAVPSDRDRVDLTEGSRQYHSALNQAQLLPEIREDRVAQLKRQLAQGNYRVEGCRIAVKMINETIENNSVLKHLDTKT